MDFFQQLADSDPPSKWMGGADGQVSYDPKENLVAIFSRWRGTVLPLVLTKGVGRATAATGFHGIRAGRGRENIKIAF